MQFYEGEVMELVGEGDEPSREDKGVGGSAAAVEATLAAASSKLDAQVEEELEFLGGDVGIEEDQTAVNEQVSKEPTALSVNLLSSRPLFWDPCVDPGTTSRS